MLLSSGPGQVLGSLVANRVFAICLVQWSGWVFETQERRKSASQNWKTWNPEPRTRTQDLARFLNSGLLQAEPRKMMWRCDEIYTFVPSSRKIISSLEVLNFFFPKPGSVTSNLECDVLWRKCDVTSFLNRPSLTPRSRFWENCG